MTRSYCSGSLWRTKTDFTAQTSLIVLLLLLASSCPCSVLLSDVSICISSTESLTRPRPARCCGGWQGEDPSHANSFVRILHSEIFSKLEKCRVGSQSVLLFVRSWAGGGSKHVFFSSRGLVNLTRGAGVLIQQRGLDANVPSVNTLHLSSSRLVWRYSGEEDRDLIWQDVTLYYQ